MQTSTGAFNTYTRSNQRRIGLQMANLSIPRTSGIYVISNTKNGKVYIGKTAYGFAVRWQDHKLRLNGDYHTNRHLQAAWNKYGAKSFKFLVLEYCAIELLDQREKHHIAIYKARGLAYNMTDGGDGVLGRIQTPETRAKISISRKGKGAVSSEQRAKLSALRKGQKANAETCAKISAANKGRKLTPEHRAKISTANKRKNQTSEHRAKLSILAKNRSPEHRIKLANALSKVWIVISPNDESTTITNLEAFCRENNLSRGSMCKVADGNQRSHKGWKCQRVVD